MTVVNLDRFITDATQAMEYNRALRSAMGRAGKNTDLLPPSFRLTAVEWEEQFLPLLRLTFEYMKAYGTPMGDRWEWDGQIGDALRLAVDHMAVQPEDKQVHIAVTATSATLRAYGVAVQVSGGPRHSQWEVYDFDRLYGQPEEDLRWAMARPLGASLDPDTPQKVLGPPERGKARSLLDRVLRRRMEQVA